MSIPTNNPPLNSLDTFDLPPTLDHIGSRINFSLLTGTIVGTCLAVYRGHAIPSYALQTGGSFAMAATAVFSGERCIALLNDTYNSRINGEEEAAALSDIKPTIKTHVLGGALGGSFIGPVFSRTAFAAFPGSMLFGVGGLFIGVAEDAFASWMVNIKIKKEREMMEDELAEELDIDIEAAKEMLEREHYDRSSKAE